jgi:hypothetical protein
VARSESRSTANGGLFSLIRSRAAMPKIAKSAVARIAGFASVPIPKFACPCSNFVANCGIKGTPVIQMILVWFGFRSSLDQLAETMTRNFITPGWPAMRDRDVNTLETFS